MEKDYKNTLNLPKTDLPMKAGLPNKEPEILSFWNSINLYNLIREENAKKEGVTVTESGLQYEVLSEGDGEKPVATDVVKVHYKGTLLDGTEFDSSYARNEPTTFPLNRVIAGWTEGLQLMSVGSKYKFTIPSELAYGDRDLGKIPANSTLVFEVELLEIQNEEAPAQ